MNDSGHLHPRAADGREPARDPLLGALLRAIMGDVPVGAVDWPGLAVRISAGIRAQRAAPWWSYAERWQRRAIPLAIAAGLVGALAFWGTAQRADAAVVTSASDLVSAVVSGESPSDAATSFLGSIAAVPDVTVPR